MIHSPDSVKSRRTIEELGGVATSTKRRRYPSSLTNDKNKGDQDYEVTSRGSFSSLWNFSACIWVNPASTRSPSRATSTIAIITSDDGSRAPRSLCTGPSGSRRGSSGILAARVGRATTYSNRKLPRPTRER